MSLCNGNKEKVSPCSSSAYHGYSMSRRAIPRHHPAKEDTLSKAEKRAEQVRKEKEKKRRRAAAREEKREEQARLARLLEDSDVKGTGDARTVSEVPKGSQKSLDIERNPKRDYPPREPKEPPIEDPE